jgi:HD superfamily phosphohydrolase YqeK
MKNFLDEMQHNYTNTGDIFFDTENFLIKYGKKHVMDHSKEVAVIGVKLAKDFGVGEYKIKASSYLHDISCVIPNENKIEFSEYLGIDIVNEEKLFPILIHQKLSKEMAKMIFRVSDDEILDSISCHTTLKANPAKLDMLLFISDKIRWDQKEEPPYKNLVEDAIKISLECGIKVYLDYVMENKEKLKIRIFTICNIYPFLRAQTSAVQRILN